jgi:hypothetical protein
MRIVGNRTQGLNVAPLTPQEAWERGRVLDAMLPNPLRYAKGISRMTHVQRNAQDDARMVEVARVLNAPNAESAHGPA